MTRTYLGSVNASTDGPVSTVTSVARNTSAPLVEIATRTANSTATVINETVLLTVRSPPTEPPARDKGIPTKRWTPMIKRADEMQIDAMMAPKNDPEATAEMISTLTKRSIPAAITQDLETPPATAVPTTSAVSSKIPAQKGAIGGALLGALPNIIINAVGSAITTTVESSMEDGEGEDVGPEDEGNEDEKKRSVPIAINMGPILGDDLLSGGLAAEEPDAVNGAVDGKLGETGKWDQEGKKDSWVFGRGQDGAWGMAGGRRVRYNGA